MTIGNEKDVDALEDITIVGLARIRHQKFARSKWCLGGGEGNMTSNGVCGLPLEWESQSSFKNGKRNPLEVRTARSSLKNRTGGGEGEEGDGGGE